MGVIMFRYTKKRYLFAFLLSSAAVADEYTFWDSSPSVSSNYSIDTGTIRTPEPSQGITINTKPTSSTFRVDSAPTKPIVSTSKPKAMVLPYDKTIRLRAPVNNPTINKNLRVSLQNNYMKEAERWYQEGGDVNSLDAQGRTLLSQSIMRHHTQGIKFLLLRRADTNKRNDNQSTPLHAAVSTNQLEVVKMLLERDAKVTPMINNDTLIHKALVNGQEKIALLLLEEGVDVQKRYGDQTLLHIAASKGQVDIAQGLLNRGADIHATFNKGVTPLHLAASRGQLNMVRLLLSRNANLKANTEKKWKPIHHAARFGHDSIVNALLSKGASANVTTAEGKTPLALAKHLHHKDVIDTLAPKTRGSSGSGLFW